MFDEPVIPQDLLTPNEAAKVIGTSSATIRRWIRSGALPGFKLGGHLRVSKADVLGMLKRVQTDRPQLPTKAEADAKAALVDKVLRDAGVRK